MVKRKKKRSVLKSIQDWIKMNQRDLILALLFALVFFSLYSIQIVLTREHQAFLDLKSMQNIIATRQVPQQEWLTISDIQNALNDLEQQLKQCRKDTISVEERNAQVRIQLNKIEKALTEFNSKMSKIEGIKK